MKPTTSNVFTLRNAVFSIPGHSGGPQGPQGCLCPPAPSSVWGSARSLFAASAFPVPQGLQWGKAFLPRGKDQPFKTKDNSDSISKSSLCSHPLSSLGCHPARLLMFEGGCARSSFNTRFSIIPKDCLISPGEL